MAIQHLETETAVKELARDIKRISTDGTSDGNLFLFGAGASYSCGIPLAAEIARDLETELRLHGRWREPNPSQPDMNPYEWAMHQLTKHEQINKIRRYIELARAADTRWKLNHCYMVLAEIWKNFPMYPRTLLTTNFDPLFYYAMLERNIEPKVIRHVAEMDLMDPFDTRVFPAIIYLHGYWQNHFILNTVAEWESFRRHWVSPLSRDIKNFGLVVIGYSGFQHDIVMQTLLHIQRDAMTQLSGRVYWCHKGEISHETYAHLQGMSDVVLVPISSADSFMLRLGEELELPEIKKIVAFTRVIEAQPPSFILEFENHAHIQIESAKVPTSTSDSGVTIVIETHKRYKRPGENYAGFDIYCTQRLFDISEYSNVVLEYDAQVLGMTPKRPSFEFKLQSGNAAHIENVPIGLGQNVTIPLSRYVKDRVDLAAVNRIVIAANCEQIGLGSRLVLTLKRVRWS